MSKNEENSIINTIDDENSGVYKVSLTSNFIFNIGYDFFGREENYSRTAYLNKYGLEIIHKLTSLFRSEFSYFSTIKNSSNDIFEQTSHFLFREFKSTIKKKGDLKHAISDKIELLKENNFISNDLNNNKITITINDIISFFKKLRKDKINFYEAILEEYKNRDQNGKDLSNWNE